MSLRERLSINAVGAQDRRKNLFESFGVIENPFPPASQPMGNPHKESKADEDIVERLDSFLKQGTTQVIVIEGTQGSGKTNLLEYYRNELQDIYGDQEGFYIIRYYSDPEPDFGAVVRRIVQEFGIEHLEKIGKRFCSLEPLQQQEALASIRGYETRQAFIALGKSAGQDEADLTITATYMFEFLIGQRIFKKHTEALGVQFRLDTTESKTQALHDLIYFSKHLGLFKALFLFLDELEKQSGLSVSAVTRYLSSIRALIDALPQNLFLILAMTTDARRRYSRMLPALAGRLQSVVLLPTLQTFQEAKDLYHFYIDYKRKEARSDSLTQKWTVGNKPLLPDEEVEENFKELKASLAQTGQQGVTQRAFLNGLYNRAEKLFTQVAVR